MNIFFFAVMGSVAGCGFMEIPRLGQELATTISGAKFNLQEASPELGFDRPNLDPVCKTFEPPVATLAEYRALRSLLKSTSPVVDPAVLDAAHKPALADAVADAFDFLWSAHKYKEARMIRQAARTMVLDKDLAPGDDLKAMLDQVLGAKERSNCANVFLTLFYIRYLQHVDPFGKANFGGLEFELRARSKDWSARNATDDDLKPRLTSEGARGDVTVFHLPRLLDSDELDSSLAEIEKRWTDHALRVLAIDLRQSEGTDLGVLDKLRASAKKGWGTDARILIAIDGETTGTPELFAGEMATHPNVQLVGPKGSQTRGYARSQCDGTAVLDTDLLPVTITLGCKKLEDENGVSLDGKPLVPRVEISADRAGDMVLQAERWAL